MTNLSLSRGRKIKVLVGFEPVDDNTAYMALDPEARVQLAQDLGTREIDDGALDKHMGLKVTPVAEITITRKDGGVDAGVYMTKEELRHHIFEARAILHSMDQAADLADAVWAKYRRGLESRHEQGDHDHPGRHEPAGGGGGSSDVE